MTRKAIVVEPDLVLPEALRREGGRAIEPHILHASEHPEGIGFGDTGQMGWGCFDRHRFEVVVRRVDVESSTWADLGELAPRGLRARYEEGLFVVASLSVVDLPVRQKDEIGLSWFDLLDAIDVDMGLAGHAADDLFDGAADTGDWFFDLGLNDGSLLYLESLAVHPSFRGQAVGARLVGSALLRLVRSRHDVAMLLAQPITTVYDAEGCKPEKTPAARKRLVNYYARMGFRKARPGPDEGEAVAMYALVGSEHCLNFRGLSFLGRPARRRRRSA